MRYDAARQTRQAEHLRSIGYNVPDPDIACGIPENPDRRRWGTNRLSPRSLYEQLRLLDERERRYKQHSLERIHKAYEVGIDTLIPETLFFFLLKAR